MDWVLTLGGLSQLRELKNQPAATETDFVVAKVRCCDNVLQCAEEFVVGLLDGGVVAARVLDLAAQLRGDGHEASACAHL